jgi:ketosteroid isomerase-like protein
MSGEDKAMQPEDVTRLVAERPNAGDAAGAAALYEPQAVLAYPADRPVTGRDAIRAIYQHQPRRRQHGGHPGVRVQVLRQQPDGSWLRIIDRPEVPQR